MDPPPVQSYLGAFIPLQSFATTSNAQYAQMEPQPQWTAPFAPVTEQNYTQKYTAKDWNTHQLEITRLYEDHTLENVIEYMKTHHKLSATPRQYKDRFKKWGINKHIQSDEMKAIIRIQEKRAADSQQPKNTAFRVRKRPVNQGKIDRYKKEHPLQSPGADPDVMDGNMSPAATPSAVSYYTPSNTGPLSPPAASFSPGTPSGAIYQFDDPTRTLPNSPAVAQMTSGFHRQPLFLVSHHASPFSPSSNRLELEQSTFTGHSPAPLSGPPTPQPQDYNMFQDGGMEFTYETADWSAFQIVLSEDHMTQPFYGTPSSLPPQFQTVGLVQSYRGGVSDTPDTISSQAADSTTMPLSEMYAAMLLYASDALIVDQCEVASKHIKTHESMYELAVQLMGRGRCDTAEQIQRHTLEVRQEVLGMKHPETLRSMDELAMVLFSQGRYETALNMHRRTLELRQEVLGLTHPDTLESMQELAMTLNYQGKYKAAEQLMRRSLDGSKKILGEEHPRTLRTLAGLANIFTNQGRDAIAEQTTLQVLSAYDKVLGLEHPITLACLHNLAVVLKSQGQLKAAENMARRALEGNEKVLWKEHPDTLGHLQNLALVLKSRGQFKAAEKLARRALEGSEKVLGKEHPDTLGRLQNLVLVLESQGQFKAAEKLARRALEGSKKVLGKEHPDTLWCLQSLALVLERQGQFKAAEKLARRALEGGEKVLGKEHPNTLRAVWLLASVLHDHAQYHDSALLYERACVGLQKILGLEHPATLGCCKEYTSMLEDMSSQNRGSRWEKKAQS